MEGTRIVASVVIGFLGLLATILSFAAEASRKTKETMYPCDEIKYPLTSLGISAALILLVTQIVANVCGGCVCCCTYGKTFLQGNTKMFATACLVLSWVAFVVGFALLMSGSHKNGQESTPTTYGYYGHRVLCIVVEKGRMGAGGALAILCTGFAIAYYLVATQVGSTSTNGVVVGKPVVEIGPIESASTGFNQGPQLGPHA